MTLYKQLALFLSLFLLVILSTVSVLKFNGSIKSAEHQLHRDAQNTAASLSLSLASAKGDETILSTMINANFDTGNYRAIVLEDMQEEVIFERLSTSGTPDVPEWFLSIVKIDVPEASAQVSSGWMVIGTLTVEGNASPSYVMLYASFKNLLISFAIFMVVSLIVLYGLLYTILRPLRELQEQAEAISHNEFRYQSVLPYTSEFREIVLSMNAMVKKVEANFKSNVQVIQQNRQKLYTEKIPKLYNEHYLMLKCNEECMENGEYDGGVVLVMELSSETKSKELQEALFISLASIVIEKSKIVSNRLVARVEESRLVVLMPGATELKVCQIKQELTDAFAKYVENETECKNYQLSSGMYQFSRHEQCQAFLAKAMARLSDGSEDICSEQKEAMRYKEQLTQEDWSYLITTALRKESFTYEVRNVLDVANNKLYDRGISIVMRDTSGTTYPYGRFIGAAVKAHKVLDIYMQVIKVMVQNFATSDKQGRYTFSFANALLLEEKTFAILQKEFENFENTHNIDFCIELPESFIVSDLVGAKRYVDLIKSHGYRFGIGEFSAESDNIDYLEQFRPEFIKISKIFLLDMIEQSSPLLSSLKMATHTLGIKIIATGISTDEELQIIKGESITIVQGMITEVI